MLKRLLSTKRWIGEDDQNGKTKQNGRNGSTKKTESKLVHANAQASNQKERRSKPDHPPKPTESGNKQLEKGVSKDMIPKMIPDVLRDVSSESLPFGDGSNKVFGYENFGYTCYLNSILQCLYSIEEFRIQVLKYSYDNKRRNRRRKVASSKIRYFMWESFDSSGHSVSHGEHQDVLLFSPSSKRKNSRGSNTNSQDNLSNHSSEHHETRELLDKSHSHTPQLKNPLSGFYKRRSSSYDRTTLSPVHYGYMIDHGNGMRETLPPPAKAIIMSPDSLTERLHQNSNRVIVGRSYNYVPVDNHKSVTFAESDDADNHVPQIHSKSGDSRANSKSDGGEAAPDSKRTLSVSERRKQCALIDGPILSIDRSLDVSKPSNLFFALKDIFDSINENEAYTGIVSPFEFSRVLKKENLLFNSMMQQDAHEFLNFLLNDINDFSESEYSRRQGSIQDNPGIDSKKSFVKELFQGVITNRIQCLVCDNVTKRDEPFLDLPIEIQQDEDIYIESIFRDFQQVEMLNAANKFYCQQCCELQEAARFVGLQKLPPILALHLKRFKYSEKENNNIKLFNKIHYPLYLEVNPESAKKDAYKKYELSSVVVHIGSGPQYGHYISLCKNGKFGWLMYDDEIVEAVDESTVLTFIGDGQQQATAYLLFYKECLDNDIMTSIQSQSKSAIDRNQGALIDYDDYQREINQNNIIISPLTEEYRLQEKNKSINRKSGSHLNTNLRSMKTDRKSRKETHDSDSQRRSDSKEGSSNDFLAKKSKRRSGIFSIVMPL